MSYAHRTYASILSWIESIQSSKLAPLLAAIIRQLNDKLGMTTSTGSEAARSTG
jgi:hypothetical protein